MKVPTVLIEREILQAWLRVNGWSKSQLAHALNVSKGRVSQLFSASSAVEPSAHLIAKLLEVTGMPFDRLFRIAHKREGASSPARRRRMAATAEASAR